ncbi:acyl-CoA dehydrogenase [Roseibium album]|uniref:3-methylmercaptopropionyl-CoA dehydrogenase n=1 Tax=Roseibium album TaxID=311410 RepID=A0A0M6ZPS6_9HYPH|nr:acyl-CoA dehydrogenase [Roseibium album]CTQ60862.1 Acyl-CoA dehydrogenase, short-chain specific [Roseibium album]CTQ64755.1 Acyl-CoA dehydrogenase, short-chain specific [Roseibium album]CTQ72952.1 Acyl-CoA dehydrogenase, short-chain specific [Roseibium album]
MYRAPVDEIAFTLKHVCGLGDLQQNTRYAELGDDLVDAIVAEAGRFAAEEIAPLNAVADKHGTPLQDGKVTTPPGWREAYHAWIDGGWNGLSADPESGGQGLPQMLSAAALEMWNSGSMSFAIGPTLTIGAVEAMEKHASDELKAKYLARLVSGEWMGTMNLTEPQAGSDLNALRARAERNDDGTYRIFGQKIFITYGDHDLTDNIIHMVLARLPDAPAGTRGISLFLVPKFLVGDDGALGARNDVRVAGVEHKMGIHGSPTCTMIYGDDGGATGWLIGEENRGLACMFTMMNNARLAVGIQGLGVAERAYQHALNYAVERKQGRAPGDKGEGMSPIARHPDIKRMLLTMKSKTQVARAICYACAHAIDMTSIADDDEGRTFWNERAGLLTPIAKALSTDFGVEVASLGVQIHGGMGYIEETGAAQHLRDARIAPIYEGTNGIQSIDLVMRKLPQSGGTQINGFIAELKAIADEVAASNRPEFGATADRLNASIRDLEEATEFMLSAQAEGRIADALSGATPYLRVAGLSLGGALLAKGALRSVSEPAARLAERTLLARSFCETVLGETAGLKSDIVLSAEAIQAFDAEALAS